MQSDIPQLSVNRWTYDDDRQRQIRKKERPHGAAALDYDVNG